MTELKIVAWTGSGSLAAVQDSREGHIYPNKADAHPIALVSAEAAEAKVAALTAERDNLGRSLRNYAKLETMAQERAEASDRTAAALRTALEYVRPIVTSLIARDYNVDTWKLNRVLDDIDAALGLKVEG